jgi:hypothetical protein
MADLLPQPDLCWADAIIISNFEAATLPLLYAPEDDCKMYFQAMKRKNPRKGLGLEAVFALCLDARRAKEDGDYMGTLRLLKEGADRRAQLFHDGDYQVVAAYEHCVWAAIHLGVLELSSTKTTAACAASSLFSFGLDVLRACRMPSAPILSSFVAVSLELVLHYNWTSYFVHRSKWHAAAHHAGVALQRWKKLSSTKSTPTGEDTEAFSRLLFTRKCLVDERVGEGVLRVRKDLAQLLQVSPMAADAEEPAADHADDIAQDNREAPRMVSLLVMSGDEERELTICLSATRPQNAWEGSMKDLTNFLISFGISMCDYSLKEYQRAGAAMLPRPSGNPRWNHCLEVFQKLVEAKHSASTALAEIVQPMPASMTRSNGLQIQRLVKKFMLSERTRKQRQKLEQERRKHLLDEGADEELEPSALEAKWRIAPSQEEIAGLLQEESKHNASVAAFTSMFPLLQRRVVAKDALKVLEQSNTSIISPAEAARCATEERQRNRPQTTIDRYKPADTTDAQSKRPTSVEPMRTHMQVAPSCLVQKDAAHNNKRILLAEETLEAYGQDTSSTPQKRRTPSPLQYREQPQIIALKDGPVLSSSERRALLSDTAVGYTIKEAESSIARKRDAYKSAARIFRTFAASLSTLADDYEEMVNAIDKSNRAFEVAMEKYSDTESSQKSMLDGVALTATCESASPVAPAPTKAASRSPVQHAPVAVTMVETDLESTRHKQRQLRALLPSIDHHSTAYRMVVKELAENEHRLQQSRNAAHLAQLALDAQMGASRRISLAHRSPNRTPPLDSMAPPACVLSDGTPLSAPHALAACWLWAVALSPAVEPSTRPSSPEFAGCAAGFEEPNTPAHPTADP